MVPQHFLLLHGLKGFSKCWRPLIDMGNDSTLYPVHQHATLAQCKQIHRLSKLACRHNVHGLVCQTRDRCNIKTSKCNVPSRSVDILFQCFCTASLAAAESALVPLPCCCPDGAGPYLSVANAGRAAGAGLGAARSQKMVSCPAMASDWSKADCCCLAISPGTC